MNKNNPIGVFDSGIGGLTILDELIHQFPHEDFIYVADTLHCPYGIKTKEEIAHLVTRNANYLMKQNVKTIVIACNTATANSNHLKDITNIPIIGVIEPTANYALRVTKSKNIAILATNATIDSKCYQSILSKNDKSITTYPVKCSEFVPLIEMGIVQEEKSLQIIKNKLQGLEEVDTVILGCTHFPLIKNEIEAILPNTNLVSSGVATANELNKVLENLDLMNSKTSLGKVYLNTTKDAKYLKDQIPWFHHTYQSIQEIEI